MKCMKISVFKLYHASGVTRVGVSCQFCSVTPIYFLLKKLTTFFRSPLSLLLISLGCHPLESVTLHLFTCPTLFVHHRRI